MGDWENAITNKQIIDKHPSNSCVQHQIFLHLPCVPKTSSSLEIAGKLMLLAAIFFWQIRYIQNAN